MSVEPSTANAKVKRIKEFLELTLLIRQKSGCVHYAPPPTKMTGAGAESTFFMTRAVYLNIGTLTENQSSVTRTNCVESALAN